MAENVQINAMSGGDVIAADDIAGVKHQRVKVGWGDDGVFTDVADTAPLPIIAASATTVDSDRATIVTGGVPTQLPDHPGICGVTVRALLANTATIYLGGASVTAATGFELAPGEAISLDVSNTNAIFIDGTDGDGVCMVGVSV